MGIYWYPVTIEVNAESEEEATEKVEALMDRMPTGVNAWTNSEGPSQWKD